MTDIPLSLTVPAGACPSPSEPDAHGQAALMLAESTLHLLMESGVLTVQQAREVVQTAMEVKDDVARDSEESDSRRLQSLHLLQGVERSLMAINPRD